MKDRMNVVNRIREFNRFYTVYLGVLNSVFIGDRTLAETRTLYEIWQNDGCKASYLVDKLRMDKSYLSRVISKLVKEGFIVKSAIPEDGRAYGLHLTDAGIEESEKLAGETNKEILEMLSNLTEEDCAEITHSMDVITNYFSAVEKTSS